MVLLGSGWVICGQKVNHGVLSFHAHIQISKEAEEKEEEEIRECMTCSPFLFSMGQKCLPHHQEEDRTRGNAEIRARKYCMEMDLNLWK